jgi:sec-independent protein translocase protein TatA
MLGDLFTGWHLIIVLALILLLFGAAKLPALAKGLGQSVRIFKGEMKTMSDDDKNAETVTPDPAATVSLPQPTSSDSQPKP